MKCFRVGTWLSDSSEEGTNPAVEEQEKVGWPGQSECSLGSASGEGFLLCHTTEQGMVRNGERVPGRACLCNKATLERARNPVIQEWINPFLRAEHQAPSPPKDPTSSIQG
jgi:hypothetical protein